MFEHEGFEYSLEEVQNAANSKGLSLEEYISQFNIKKIEDQGKTQPQVPGAPVEITAAPDTDSSSASFSSAFLSQASTPGYNPYVVAADLISAGKSLKNTIYNLIGVDFSTPEETIYTMGPLGASTPMSPRALKTATSIAAGGATILNSFNLLSDKKTSETLTQNEEANKLLKQAQDIVGSVDKGPASMIAGVFDAFTNMGYSVLTGATSMGVVPIAEQVGSIIGDYNVTKAKNKYKDLDTEQALDKLINENEIEILRPGIYGAAAGIAEKIGLGKMASALKKSNVVKDFSKTLLNGPLTEGVTEWIQSGIEVASAKSAEEASKVKIPVGSTGYSVPLQDIQGIEEGVEFAFGKGGLEAALQGLVGGGVMVGGNYGGRKFGPQAVEAMTAVRYSINENKVEELTDDIASLREKQFNTKSQNVKDAIEEEIKVKYDELNGLVVKANGLFEALSDSDYEDITNNNKLQQVHINKINELREEFDNGFIDEQEYTEASDIYKKKYLETRNKIKGIVNKAQEGVSQKNIDIAQKNKDLFSIIKDPEASETQITRAKSELFENNSGLINGVVNRFFNPNLDTDLTREDFASEVSLEFSKLINTFDPTKEAEFGAYASKILPLRVPGIFDRSLQTTQEGEFIATEDITERRDIAQEEVSEDAIKQEVIKTMTSELNIPSDLSQTVESAVTSVFSTKLPAVTDKRFKKSLQDSFRDALADNVKTIFGKKRDDYRKYLVENFDKLYQNMPQEAFNKRLPGLAEAVTDETGKQLREKTAVGKGVFKKKDITAQEFADYFVGENLTPQLISNRKVKLAEIVAEEIAKDATAKVIADPEVASKFKEVQQLLGQEVPADFQQKIAKIVDRLDSFIQKLESNDGTIRASFGIVEILRFGLVQSLKVFRNTLKTTGDIVKALDGAIKEIKKYFVTTESQQEAEKLLKQYLSKESSINEKALNELAEKLNTLSVKELREYIVDNVVLQDFNAAIESSSNKKDAFNVVKDFIYYNSKGLGTIFSDKKSKRYLEFSSLDKMFNKIIKPKLEEKFPDMLGELGFESKKGKTAAETGIFFRGSKISRLSDTKKLFELDQVDQINIEAGSARKYFLNKINALKELNDTEKALAYLRFHEVDQRGVLRKIYKAGIKTNTTEKTILEHNPPIAVLSAEIKKYINNEVTFDKLNDLIDKSTVNLIPKKADDILNKKGLKDKVKQGVNVYEETDSRYQDEDFSNVMEGYDVENVQQREFYLSEIIEDLSKGAIKASEKISSAEAASIKTAKTYGPIRPFANDLAGLLQDLVRKRKQGDIDYKFFKENITDPFNAAQYAFDAYVQAKSKNFKSIYKKHKTLFKSSNEQVLGPYTNDQVIRAYMYIKAGSTAEKLGLSEQEVSDIVQYVNDNTDLLDLVNDLYTLYDGDEFWITPESGIDWTYGSIKQDVVDIVSSTQRAPFFEEWVQAKNSIFTKDNLNKIEALKGKEFRLALEDIFYRMETGRARPEGTDPAINAMWNWFRGSVAVTMFLNTRSAILQTISFANYANWSDNNPAKMAAAYANAPQFAEDFLFLINSDYLRQRRGGLSIDVNTQDIANDFLKSGKQGARSIIRKLLQAGFSFTQAGDSFAISFGGATFYRNRLNSYLNQGLDQQQAERQAFLDFMEKTEESQQSARPDKLAKQQVTKLGRIFLAFQNTPMQYTRLIVRAFKDIAAGRGDIKENLSKIAYYGFIQNITFSVLQNALFMFMFDDEEQEEDERRQEIKEKKVYRVVNNVLDTFLRGTGIFGGVAATAKNVILEFIEQEKRPIEAKGRADHMYTFVEIAQVSPPIGIKARKVAGAIDAYRYNKGVHERMGADVDNPALDIITNTVSAGVNLPADRALSKIRNLKAASDQEQELINRLLLVLGWNTWDLDISKQREKTAEIKKQMRAERSKRKPGAAKQIKPRQL